MQQVPAKDWEAADQLKRMMASWQMTMTTRLDIQVKCAQMLQPISKNLKNPAPVEALTTTLGELHGGSVHPNPLQTHPSLGSRKIW
jgi:hypothetical protein